MSFKPCLLIPVYNHGAQLVATLNRLKPLQLPCLVVDDGSDTATVTQLQRLLNDEEWLTLFRQSPNQGKGVAVLRGVEEAGRLGFSHVVQVDADGQHDLADIPAMLAMAEAEPQALISGAPIYDASVPRSRLYGRYITHFWVWIETLSLEIVDSMCGFRVYPVSETHDLAQSHSIAKRMDFDTDIMVRLFWQGVPVRFLPSKVSYPEDGVSHFSLWRDNLRITRMHTRLVFGMLLRLPMLMKRRWAPASLEKSSTTEAKKTASAKEIPGKHWSEVRERGSYFGLWISICCYRFFGRRVLKLLLYPIISYFFVTNTAARRASQEFLQRIFLYHQPSVDGDKDGGENGVPKMEWTTVAEPYFATPPTLLDSFRHFMTFGDCVVDRLGSWSGEIDRDQVEFVDRKLLHQCVDGGRGGVILSSHLGNAEMCRALVDNSFGIKINVLAFSNNAAQLGRLMKRVNPRAEMELIQIADIGPDTAMLLASKIEQGEFVVITADRTSPSAPEKSIQVPFLGKDAAFPQGAFILAGLLQCPVFSTVLLEARELPYLSGAFC